MTTRLRIASLSSAILITSALSTTLANAASLDADLNNDTLAARYHLSDANADLDISVGLMLTDDKGEVGTFTVRTQGTLAEQQSIRGGFGLRGYYASPEGGDDFQGLGLGGHLSVAVPQAPDFSIGVEVYFVPSVTLTDDIDNMREVLFRANYQLFKNASVYVGLRHLEVEQDEVNVDYEFDDGIHAGFTLQF